MKTKTQAVFQRYEKKYLLTMQQHKALLDALQYDICMDHYGVHTICNLYLDTDDFQLIRTSIEKPIYKEKLRLRSYGVPDHTDTVFLELKKKYDGIVYKRRISLPLEEAMNYISYGIKPKKTNQIFKEIHWAMSTYEPSPKTFIAYDRSAYFGVENPNLRITFDQKIRYRYTNVSLTKGDGGTFLLSPQQILMEIKIPGAMPLWLSHLLSDLQIYPTSFSKYGNCYKQYLQQQIGGFICA